MGASGAKYGIMTSHFYWVGAIPAMVFLGDLHDAVLLRLARRARCRSICKLRFDEKTRGFNAISFAVMTVFSSGISMYALATLLETAPRLELSTSASSVSARRSCWSTSSWAG